MQIVRYYIQDIKSRKYKAQLLKKLDSIIGIKLLEIDEVHNGISFIFTSLWGSNLLAECYISQWDNGKLQCCES